MAEGKDLSHFDGSGQVSMVDVTEKEKSDRRAVARATVNFPSDVLDRVLGTGLEKGDLFSTARLAGIQGAKETSRLIPLAHPISISHVSVDLTPNPEANSLEIETKARATDATGVEMEALTGATVAALTIYDMCKGAAKGIEIEQVYLVEKTGGTSGRWVRDNEEQ